MRYALTSGQRRAWFLQTRAPGDSSLTIAITYRLTGDLDASLLRAAVADVVARHEILRTTYGSAADGEPYQVISPIADPDWHEDDLSSLSPVRRARRAEVLIRRVAAEAFDPAARPPIRFALFRTGGDEYVFAVVAHALCWDDESWEIFARDLTTAYNGKLPAAPARPYLTCVRAPEHMAAVETSCVAGELADANSERRSESVASPAVSPRAQVSSEAALEFWRRELLPIPEPLELPGTAVSADAGAARSRRSVRELPRELAVRVDEFADARGISAFSVLLAAFDVLAYRYTGAVDFLVAVPVTTRDERSAPADPGAPIGYFGNTVVLRAAVEAALSFAYFAAAVDNSWTRAYEYRQVGIDRVVHAINPDRSVDRDGLAHLVRLGFGVRHAPAGLDLEGVVAARLELESPAPRVPLRLTVIRDGEGAYLEAEYAAGRFTPELMDALLVHYVRLLSEGVARPERPVGALDLLDAAERADVLARSRGERVPVLPTTLVALFEQRARLSADTTALIAPGASAVTLTRTPAATGRRGGDGTADGDDLRLTYDDLNRRANRLAHWLISQGVGTEDVVALRLSNSVEFVVAVLAVLKSGAAYLPIDPSYPDERIDFLIADARPRLVLGRVELDAAEEQAADLPPHDPNDADRLRPLRPGNLAYVIYTSGSTGRPKGVPVSHAAIADHLVGFTAQWGMTAEDRLLQAASVSFDASLLDVFVTLTLGARLIVPRPGGFSDLAYIAELITRYGVTVLHMVPSLLRTFLSLPQVKDWRTLRLVPVGGEPLPGDIADRFAGVLDAELRNHYGPTEAVVSVTHQRVGGPQGSRIVPIGGPNRNVDLYLLDARMRLVPPGVTGEIYLGGPQLARGYAGRAAATAERFVADPFTPGARLYRTGDLARRDSAGALEFVGRADDQVKVRGHRIELGEVQAALTTHPHVRDCVVALVGDAALGPVLAAYLVADPEVVELDSVRAHAAASLPEYMVPTTFAVIEAIPLTEHGKLDRRALPEPIRLAARPYREPATATEIRLAALYGQLLGRDAVGADDSFFALGGHSLLANQLVARIHAEFGFELDVRAVFDTPAVCGLAAVLEASAVAARVPVNEPPRQRNTAVPGTPSPASGFEERTE
ncbi:amino acid adenylation domain-containing protein [Nocardia yunnanensis]|uniref:Amino acid adenylation domain-containing protein n=1 Tax=Nocardia yunnanensis TaxID=2382165 RepID=A0A386ZPE2_9NOCA|nr:amino acid adenylation domain-containing protein [Nocardia yunnanensis]